MKKLYRKLTKEQRDRGVIFSSTLSKYTTEVVGDKVHEVMADNPNRDDVIRNLKDDKFFNNSPYKYNIIRT